MIGSLDTYTVPFFADQNDDLNNIAKEEKSLAEGRPTEPDEEGYVQSLHCDHTADHHYFSQCNSWYCSEVNKSLI